MCSGIWKLDDAVEEAKDVMRSWTYKHETQDVRQIPPLCTHVIAFSACSLTPWTIAATIVSALQDVVLQQMPIQKVVEATLCLDRSIMAGTGVVYGTVVEDKDPKYYLYLRSDAEVNLFGLDFPRSCTKCHASTLCLPVDTQDPQIGSKARVVCSMCGWGTSWVLPPEEAKVKLDDHLFCWLLPLPAQEWTWVAPQQSGDSTPYSLTVLSYC